MSARQTVIDGFKALLAASDDPQLQQIVVVDAARDVGEAGRTVRLIFKTDRYTRTPAAPQRNITWRGTATLVSPHRDQVRAEAQLEGLIDALLPYLSSSSWAWDDAQLVNFDDQLLALDIRLSAIFQKE
jgi:hypothetical protein